MSTTCNKGLFTNRFRQHRTVARSGKFSPLYNAWRKYGEPTQVILSLHGNRELCSLDEIQAIIDYKSIDREFGYNIANGGQGLNFHNNPALYELMKIKVWQNSERIRKTREANKGKKPSQATIDGHKAWSKTDAAKEMYARPWASERIKRASELTSKQMANGGAEYLKLKFKDRKDARSVEGKQAQKEKIKALMNTEYGKEIARKGHAAMISNPENVKKYREGSARWRESDANKENCKRMAQLSAQKNSKKVMLNGQIFDSQHKMAQTLNVSDACVSLWVKEGKVTRI